VLRDILEGPVVQKVQPKRLLIFVRQFRDQLTQVGELIPRDERAFHRRLGQQVIQLIEPLAARSRLPLAYAVDRQIPGDLEEVGPHETDSARKLELQKPYIRLLCHLVRRLDILEPGGQVQHQRAIVFPKEARDFRRARGVLGGLGSRGRILAIRYSHLVRHSDSGLSPLHQDVSGVLFCTFRVSVPEARRIDARGGDREYTFSELVRLSRHNTPCRPSNGTGELMQVLRAASFAALCGIFCLTARAMDVERKIDFHIAPQRLSTALLEFSHQANIQILIGPAVGDRKAPGLSGPYSIAGGLTILLQDSALSYRVVNDTSITVGYRDGSPTSPPSGTSEDPAVATVPQAPDAGAATADSGLQEIIVTATRREESLSKVPISMTAMSQGTMETLGIKDVADLARFTPGVSILDSGNNVSITIRGIGSSAGAATTGIYIDDTPIQERALAVGSQAIPKSFDLDRVEVLRGPQGTLFGAGSEGGTVRYIMTQPSLTTSSQYVRSEVSETQGGAPSYEVGAAGGTPLIENQLGVRASLWYRRDGGWIDLVNPSTLASVEDNANYGETTAARIAARWAPTSDISITPSLMYQDRKLHNLQTYWGTLSDPSRDDFVSANPSRAPEDDSYALGALKVSADLGPLDFVSNTSAFYRNDRGAYDGTLSFLAFYQTLGWPPDGIPFAGSDCPTHASCYPFVDGAGVHLPPGLQDYRVQASVTQTQDVFTQEFRLQSRDPDARIAWTVGAFYSIERTTSIEEDRDPGVDRFFNGVFGTTLCRAFGLPCNADGSTPLPNGDSYLGDLAGHDRQLAGFGEAVWTLTDRLKLTTGLRYSKIGFTSTSYANGPINYGSSYTTGEESEHPITERVGLAFQQSANNLYYATYSTGFRPGGANAPIPESICSADFNSFGIGAAPTSYKSDTVRSYELGAKNTFDNRLQLAGSLYYVQWNSIQQNVVLPTCQFTYTANLGAAVSKGGDLDLTWLITDTVDLNAAVGYTSAAYTKSIFPGPEATTPVVAKGDVIVAGQGAFSEPTSPWTVALGAQYKFNVYSLKSFARLDYEFASKNNRPFAGDDSRTVQYDPYLTTTSGHTFVSARAGTEFNSWSVSVFIDNLLNAHTITSLAHTTLDGSGPQPPVSPLYTYTSFRPRTFGLTLIYRN
jgi:iron complex outermembrane recepter protein